MTFSWGTEAVTAKGQATNPRLAFDPQGRPHIVYRYSPDPSEYSSGDFVLYHEWLMHAWRSAAGEWSREIIQQPTISYYQQAEPGFPDVINEYELIDVPDEAGFDISPDGTMYAVYHMHHSTPEWAYVAHDQNLILASCAAPGGGWGKATIHAIPDKYPPSIAPGGRSMYPCVSAKRGLNIVWIDAAVVIDHVRVSRLYQSRGGAGSVVHNYAAVDSYWPFPGVDGNAVVYRDGATTMILGKGAIGMATGTYVDIREAVLDPYAIVYRGAYAIPKYSSGSGTSWSTTNLADGSSGRHHVNFSPAGVPWAGYEDVWNQIYVVRVSDGFTAPTPLAEGDYVSGGDFDMNWWMATPNEVGPCLAWVDSANLLRFSFPSTNAQFWGIW